MKLVPTWKLHLDYLAFTAIEVDTHITVDGAKVIDILIHLSTQQNAVIMPLGKYAYSYTNGINVGLVHQFLVGFKTFCIR